MGEFIGKRLRILEAPSVSPIPLEGQIVDETMNMFYLRLPGRSASLAVPKQGLKGTLISPEGELDLIGDVIRVRPEDRIKRWATKRMAK